MTKIAVRLLLASTALLGAAVLAVSAALAHDFSLGALHLEHPWARASAGPAGNGAAYLVIDNSGAADRLIGAAGDIAERAELHVHKMEGDVMKMRKVEAVDIPAGGSAALQPGGYHVMLIGLKRPLVKGDSFPLTLTFEKAGAITVNVMVEGVASMGPQGEGDAAKGATMNHGTMAPSN